MICVAFSMSIQCIALACAGPQVVDPIVSSDGSYEIYFNPQNSYCTSTADVDCSTSTTSGTESIYQNINGSWVYTGDNVANSISQAWSWGIPCFG